ncbi:hypothetical protein GIY11_10435 [Aerococcaceae bacterium DSM 109653]|uniref:BlaI/MecI/CopY family transcriptional regulator n=1 Tax=Fundicoccus ignavus TaxID=2664442 RepID=A0A844C144_9LACT|nr:BlaI/MecI/CopY family transcriptional regulator [Fundicoccus ignavus]MRI82426.1 hypothetical protein [Fundicoccus ignavus]
MLKNRISNRERDILSLMWEANEALTAKQICDLNEDLVMSTVQTTLRNLLKNKLIKVDEIVFSGKALSRCYLPTISQEEFIVKQFESIDLQKFMTAFLGQEQKISEEEINKIEELLEQARKSE